MDVAALTQQLSIAAFAREQRRLISVDGARYPLPTMLATIYASNAISVSLPFVGGGLTMLSSVVPATAIVVGLRNPALRVRVGAN